MIPVKDTHMTTAMEMIPNWRQDNLDPMSELWKKGYLRITYMYDGALIAHNELRPPSEKQVSELKNIAMEGDHRKIEWDSGENTKILWTDQDALSETVGSNIQYVGPEDIEYDYSSDLNRMEKESGIRVLRGKELDTLALQNGKVVGALYVEMTESEFSFDVIVDKPARGQGIGAKLIDMALTQYSQESSEMGTALKVDVVNPWVEKYLLHKGLKVLQKVDGHTIMTK
jgi:ribosomal protein S18 acetylase RimI-like enzyme